MPLANVIPWSQFEQRVGHRLKLEEKDQILAQVTRITQHITRLKDLLAKQTTALQENDT
jgi:hypothetical protein